MHKLILPAVAIAATLQLNAQFFEDLAQPKPKQKFGELTFTGGSLAASRKTGEMTATGNITAQSGDAQRRRHLRLRRGLDAHNMHQRA